MSDCANAIPYTVCFLEGSGEAPPPERSVDARPPGQRLSFLHPPLILHPSPSSPHSSMSSDLHKTKTGKCVPQKLRRNERERKRVHQVNLGFERLRDRVPAPGPNKKWSKADTLREAVKYIRFLREQLLAEEEAMLNQTTSFHKTERDFSGEFYQEIRPFHPQEMNASFPATRCSLNSPESGYGSTLSPEVFSRQQHPQCPSHSSSF